MIHSTPKFVDYNSPEYHQAAQLRYQLFYQKHNIPFDSIFDPQEADDQHLVIVQGDRVLAYGRLGQNNTHEFQIYQMVVVPDYQRHGLGHSILQTLIEQAERQGATQLVLHARVTKVPFYRQSGFKPIGEIFPSVKTGVPHIKMVRL